MKSSFREKCLARRQQAKEQYHELGFISSGTYGKVFKACLKKELNATQPRLFAIKKFKHLEWTNTTTANTNSATAGVSSQSDSISVLSQSACREIGLCRELEHEHIVQLHNVMVDPLDRSIYMVFDYAEHDLLQILHHHSHTLQNPIPEPIVKSLIFQLLDGLQYLHSNWILHRDMKPANILVTSQGIVKIGDLGLARLFHRPLLPLFNADKVVVTIWYRSPELLLGARHYTKAIDIWAVGCIFAELFTLRPLFKGDEVKPDHKKHVPFQRSQLTKICEVLGTPSPEKYPDLMQLPDSAQLKTIRPCTNCLSQFMASSGTVRLGGAMRNFEKALSLLSGMLEYDPKKRLTAEQALQHSYFQQVPLPMKNAFVLSQDKLMQYPERRISAQEH